MITPLARLGSTAIAETRCSVRPPLILSSLTRNAELLQNGDMEASVTLVGVALTDVRPEAMNNAYRFVCTSTQNIVLCVLQYRLRCLTQMGCPCPICCPMSATRSHNDYKGQLDKLNKPGAKTHACNCTSLTLCLSPVRFLLAPLCAGASLRRCCHRPKKRCWVRQTAKTEMSRRKAWARMKKSRP